MKKLYLFDFDGTLTYKDTMFMFLKFYNPTKYAIQFLKHIPLFIFLKLKLANAESVKKSFISSILKGESRSRINDKAGLFFNENYPSLIRSKALQYISKIDINSTDLYLVSASLDIWLRPFAKQFNMKLLSTEAEFHNEIFTGEFMGSNCNNAEKVNRIKIEIGDKKYDKIIAFGDTSGDKEMLDFANESYFRFFH